MSVGPFGPGGSVFTQAPGASLSVEAAFAAHAPAGGSVMAFAPGASMSTEAAFAAYAPAGGSLGLNAYGSSIGVEAAFANALQSGLFAGSSLGVEAAFAQVAPTGGSMNLPGFSYGFEGSSIGVEAAFLDHGPRNPTGLSCMTGAGASMAVEAAFFDHGPRNPTGLSCMTGAGASMALEAPSEMAPPAQLGGFLAPDAPIGRVALAAPDAPVGRGFFAAPDAPVGRVFLPAMAEESSTPRPAGVSPVLPQRQTSPGPRAQPAPLAVTQRRQGDNSSFRAAPPIFQYSTRGAGNDVSTNRSFQPPLATEVRPYPYMYPASEFRQEPALTDRLLSQPFDRYAHSYTPVATSSVPRDTPSYIPRVTPSAAPHGLSLQQLPPQGLSLQQVPAAPSMSYPGPMPQRHTSPYAAVPAPFVAQAQPLTIESTPAMFFSAAAATSPAAIPAPMISRQPQRGTTMPGLQTIGALNGNTARYSPPMQPAAPTQRRSSVMPNMASAPYQIPTAAYIRPTQIPSQVPSFISPVVPSARAPQVPSYTGLMF